MSDLFVATPKDVDFWKKEINRSKFINNALTVDFETDHLKGRSIGRAGVGEIAVG